MHFLSEDIEGGREQSRGCSGLSSVSKGHIPLQASGVQEMRGLVDCYWSLSAGLQRLDSCGKQFEDKVWTSSFLVRAPFITDVHRPLLKASLMQTQAKISLRRQQKILIKDTNRLSAPANTHGTLNLVRASGTSSPSTAAIFSPRAKERTGSIRQGVYQRKP